MRASYYLPCRAEEVLLFDSGIAVLQNTQYSRIEIFVMIASSRWQPVYLSGRTGGQMLYYNGVLKV